MSTKLVRSVIEMLQSQLTMGTLHPEISRTLGTVHSYIIYNAGYRYIYIHWLCWEGTFLPWTSSLENAV